jgi:hypothetical protein
MPPVGDAAAMRPAATPSAAPPPDGEVIARPAQVLQGGKMFTPEEQSNLLLFKDKLERFAEAYEKLSDLIDGEESGLPDAKDTNRCRLGDDSFSLQDARRELKNEWLSGKLQRYVQYIDAALGDQVTGQPQGAGTRGTSSPLVRTPVRKPIDPEQSPGLFGTPVDLPAMPKLKPFAL